MDDFDDADAGRDDADDDVGGEQGLCDGARNVKPLD